MDSISSEPNVFLLDTVQLDLLLVLWRIVMHDYSGVPNGSYGWFK